MVPYDLQTLHNLRKRGQCPTLPVFVTERRDWQRRLTDLGSLCIRVETPDDTEHDWRALSGLHCILLTFGDILTMGSRYEELQWKILKANPSQFEVFFQDLVYGREAPSFSTVVVGIQEPILKIFQRDKLLWRLLRTG